MIPRRLLGLLSGILQVLLPILLRFVVVFPVLGDFETDDAYCRMAKRRLSRMRKEVRLLWVNGCRLDEKG